VQLHRVMDAVAPNRLEEYAGTYYSAELGVSWTIELREGRLVRRQWMLPDQMLRPVLPDIFTGELSEGRFTLQFRRGATGSVDAFAVATTMVGPRAFQRCEPLQQGEPLGPLGMACRLSDPALQVGRGPSH
jgi:hypothetical protein